MKFSQSLGFVLLLGGLSPFWRKMTLHRRKVVETEDIILEATGATTMHIQAVSARSTMA